MCLHYKICWLMLFKKIIAVDPENRKKKQTVTFCALCWQNTKFLNIGTGGTYSNHVVLSG
jgi:hypothetical protein